MANFNKFHMRAAALEYVYRRTLFTHYTLYCIQRPRLHQKWIVWDFVDGVWSLVINTHTHRRKEKQNNNFWIVVVGVDCCLSFYLSLVFSFSYKSYSNSRDSSTLNVYYYYFDKNLGVCEFGWLVGTKRKNSCVY